MKKQLTIAGLSILGLGLAYLGGIGFYSDRFISNTKVMNVDVGNLNLEDSKAHLIEELSSQEMVLTENGEELSKVKIADLNPNYNIDKELEKVYYGQNPNEWLVDTFNHTVSAGETQSDLIEIQTDEIVEEINQIGEREPAIDARIEYDEENHYHAVPGENGTYVDAELLEDAIVKELIQGNTVVEVETSYEEPTIKIEDDRIQSTLQTIDNVINSNVTISIAGEEIVMEADVIEEWLYFDDQNQMLLDPEKLTNFLYELDEKYSTIGKTRTFKSTMQGTVEVPPGILGWGVDVETSANQLSNLILNGEGGTYDIATISTGGVPGAEDDIGDTYIEIDLTNQMMFLYVDGDLIVSTDIVSGQIGAETIPGANAVNEMLYQTNLKGYNPFYKVEYSTPVDYWIRFDDQAQGIHDASWQGSFGGNTYQYSGSLGCINTPYEAVSTIYEHVDIGTPVIVFY